MQKVLIVHYQISKQVLIIETTTLHFLDLDLTIVLILQKMEYCYKVLKLEVQIHHLEQHWIIQIIKK